MSSFVTTKQYVIATQGGTEIAKVDGQYVSSDENGTTIHNGDMSRSVVAFIPSVSGCVVYENQERAVSAPRLGGGYLTRGSNCQHYVHGELESDCKEKDLDSAAVGRIVEAMAAQEAAERAGRLK